MGTWDNNPWDNDEALDWLGDLFNKTKLDKKIAQAFDLDHEEYPETIRMAAYMLINLGQIYIWPLDRLEGDLEKAIKVMEKIKNHEIYEDDKVQKQLAKEIKTLKTRLSEIKE